MNQKTPFTQIIDLTGGKLSSGFTQLSKIPTWDTFSISRIRQATDISLPTTGHLISHNLSEAREKLWNQRLSNLLILDDTSFSGSTSILVESHIKEAFPERKIKFTHGFLILNSGSLGKNPGAKERLTKKGSKVVSGMEMKTPKDDGWHFFDIVNQKNIDSHLSIVEELINMINQPNFGFAASVILSDEKNLNLMFPSAVSSEELRELQKTGNFLPAGEIKDGFHVRNPQLLPNIIGQNHISHPDKWKASKKEVFNLLTNINKLINKGE